ncbi:MAG: hypothetical protein WBG71_11695 [Leeuwenhoekiella sp.]
MNYNLISYLIYFLIMAPIIISVGYACYTNGKTFVYQLLADHELSQRVNHTLLIGYYLVNLGIVLYSIQSWETLANIAEVVERIALLSGRLIVILGVLHFINIGVIVFLLKRNTKKSKL